MLHIVSVSEMLRIGMGEEQGTLDELQMRGLAVLFFTHRIDWYDLPAFG